MQVTRLSEQYQRAWLAESAQHLSAASIGAVANFHARLPLAATLHAHVLRKLDA